MTKSINKPATTCILVAITFSLLASCGEDRKKKNNSETDMEETRFKQGSFGYDLEFIRERDTGAIVLQEGKSRVLVSPKYQAKVFTSSASNQLGDSYGWINYEAFDGESDPHMNAYGGENRFWLGPEGSRYSLFFKPDAEMIFDNWKTPPPIDTEPWEVTGQSSTAVSMRKDMSLENYAGTKMDMRADREVRILEREAIAQTLGIQLGDLQTVGFSTDNSLTNTGDSAWTKESGAPSIWILDMFIPSDETVIFIPYEAAAEGPVVTSDYFGEIPAERLKYDDGKLFFNADGKSRGKLGLSPDRSKSVAGSYDAANQVLTITTFDLEKDAVYLNQEWTPDKDPYKGDAINAYNDGPLEDGSQMGPFYELESVSPAAFLAPGETINHQHNVFHFSGQEEQLNQISQEVLGVSLEEMKQAF